MKAKKKKLIYNSVTFGLVIAAFLICQLLLSTGGMSRSFRGQLIPICCWIVMAVSLNLVVGISGELSLGHAGFMSIGAFTGIIVSGWMQRAFQMEDPVLRLILAMVIGAVLAGIAGALIGIPVLRLKGDYLAIVTLAFGEIIRNLIDCLYVSVDGQSLRFGFLNNKLRFSGFIDFWRGEKADGHGCLVILSEPQLWYNITEHFSVGTEWEFSNNFVYNSDPESTKTFFWNPTLAVKWNF